MTINQSDCNNNLKMNTMAPPAATVLTEEEETLRLMPLESDVPEIVPTQHKVCQVKQVPTKEQMTMVVPKTKVIPTANNAKVTRTFAPPPPPPPPERQTVTKTANVVIHESSAAKPERGTLPSLDNCESQLTAKLMAPATTRRLISAYDDRVRRQIPALQSTTVRCSRTKNTTETDTDWKIKLNRELLEYQQQLNRQMEKRKVKKQLIENKSSALASLDSTTVSLSTAPSSRPDSAKSRSSQASSDSCGKVLPSITTTATTTASTTTTTSRPSPVEEEAADVVVNAKEKSKSDRELAPSRDETLMRLGKANSKSAQGERRAPVNPNVASITRPRVVKVETPYERILQSLSNDPTWLKEVSFGRRIGFYRFRGDIGYGNFSQVKVATHILTKGKCFVSKV